jgi:hypothetical protein
MRTPAVPIVTQFVAMFIRIPTSSTVPAFAPFPGSPQLYEKKVFAQEKIVSSRSFGREKSLAFSFGVLNFYGHRICSTIHEGWPKLCSLIHPLEIILSVSFHLYSHLGS